MSAKLPRLFFAISVPQDLRELVGQIQHNLSNFNNLITWVKPDQAHITLRFLGNRPEDKLSDIISCSRSTFSKTSQFVLGDSILKVFPDVKYPRVLLIDFKKGVNEFLVLQRNLDKALLARGLVFKNPKVRPHLTIGRIKEKALPSERQALVLRLSQAFRKPPRFTEVDLAVKVQVKVQEIHLIQSQLTPKGPIYKELHQFNLGLGG